MRHARFKLDPVSRPSCDIEPILIPGAIQPHGLLLLFDADLETTVYWAGDFGRLLGAEPAINQPAAELLGVPLSDLIGERLLVAGDEAVHVGAIEPPSGQRLSVVVSRTSTFIAVELEPTTDTHTAATALERVRAVSNGIHFGSTLADACDSAVAHARGITGYDRMMVYKFLGDGSGLVIAEARAPDMRAFMTHHFPASDIPNQARDLYRRNLVRVTPDVAYTPAPLQPSRFADAVDMSQYALRSISPTHIQYLKNMGVGASMSISLLVHGELWGLITGHHRAARYVTVENRLLCRHVGTALSGFIQNFEQAEHAQRNAESLAALEDTLRSLRFSSDPERTLRASADGLAKLVDCGGFALLARGTVIAGVGRLPDTDKLRGLANLLEAELAGRDSFATDRLGETIAGVPDMATDVSGVLAVRIDASRPLLALWVKPEQVEEICWAGDPRAKDAAPTPLVALSPRRSFATRRETVGGRSRAWARHEIELVELLRGRAELTMQRHRLKQLNEELGAANTTLRSLATTDALTGLANRRLFDERLTTEWQRARRDDISIAVVAIDIDNFKKYNDSFGHPAGDSCLKQVAAALAGGRRGVDVAARLGGEEFALLLTDIEPGEAGFLAGRVRLAVEQLGLEHPLNDGGVVTVSLGVAAGTPAHWGDHSRLIGAADEALYQAKAQGRNRVEVANLPEPG